MADAAIVVGTLVQTAMGKGTVREVRKNGRLLVEVQSRALVIDAGAVRPLDVDVQPKARWRRASATGGDATDDRLSEPRALLARAREVDLHGLTVDEAMARVDAMLDRCLQDGIAELRVIHGRSGGRLRAALHRRLSSVTSIRGFHVDPANAGVTVVSL